MNEWVWRIDGITLTAENWNLSHCYFVHHKSYMDCRVMERRPPRWEAGNQLSEPRHGPTFLLYGYTLPHVSFIFTHVTQPDSVIQVYLKCSDNKVRELIAVKVLHTSLLNTTVVAFKVLPLESYAPMQAPSSPSKQFWNRFYGMAFRAAVVLLLMSSVSSKCLPFNISFTFGNRKSNWGLGPVNSQGVPT